MGSLRTLFQKAGIVFTNEKIKIAMSAFKTMSPNQNEIDMNQLDIIMGKLGIKDPFICHQVFIAFDTDNSHTIDFHEFIWGLSMVYKAPLAESFETMWSSLCEDERFQHLNLDYESGTLTFAALSSVLYQAGCIKDPILLRECVYKLFNRLDSDGSGSVDYEEFRVNLITDAVVEKIFIALLFGKGVKDVAEDLKVPYDPTMVIRKAIPKSFG